MDNVYQRPRTRTQSRLLHLRIRARRLHARRAPPSEDPVPVPPSASNEDRPRGLQDGEGDREGRVWRGKAGAEDGYGEGVCDEDVEEGGDVEEGSGMLVVRFTLEDVDAHISTF